MAATAPTGATFANKASTSTNWTLSPAGTFSPGSGDTIFVVAFINDSNGVGGGYSVSDSLGNNFILDMNLIDSGLHESIVVARWMYASSQSGVSVTLHVTTGGDSIGGEVNAFMVGGLGTYGSPAGGGPAGLVDLSPTNSGTGLTASVGSNTVKHGDEFVLYLAANQANKVITVPTSGATNFHTNSAADCGYGIVDYLLIGPNGGKSVSSSWGIATSTAWIAGILTYRTDNISSVSLTDDTSSKYSDTSSRTGTHPRSITDDTSAKYSDNPSRLVVLSKNITDSTNSLYSEILSKTVNLPRNVLDSASSLYSEVLSKTVNLPRTITDSASSLVTDLPSRVIGIFRNVLDNSFGLVSDNSFRLVSISRVVSDNTSGLVSDVSNRVIGLMRNIIIDTSSLFSEFPSKSVYLPRSLLDDASNNNSDNLSRGVVLPRGSIDNSASLVTDSPNRQISLLRIVMDNTFNLYSDIVSFRTITKLKLAVTNIFAKLRSKTNIELNRDTTTDINVKLKTKTDMSMKE